MYFTREPIIETIISARDGYKLSIRSSKSCTENEIVVDAVEVVSFGKQNFYRALEKGNAFLLPVADFQIIELRTQVLALKTSSKEKEIKIGKVKEEETSKEDRKKEKKKRTKTKQESKTTEKNEIPAEKIEDEIPPEKREAISSKFLIPPPEGLISESFKKPSLPADELELQEEVAKEEISES